MGGWVLDVMTFLGIAYRSNTSYKTVTILGAKENARVVETANSEREGEGRYERVRCT